MNTEEKINMWLEHIESYKARKGSAVDWCKENNISLSTLKYWMTKLHKGHKDSSEPKRWIPVEVTNSPGKSHHKPSSSGIRIDIGSASILLSSEFDPQTLESVIEILSKKC